MNPKPLDRDTTIADIHRTRERIAAESGGNIATILEDARRRQAAGGRPIWQAAATAAPKTSPDEGQPTVSGQSPSSS